MFNLSFLTDIYFNTSFLLYIARTHSHIQIMSTEDGMRLVLGGRFAFVHTNYLSMRILVDTYYTDKTGYTPIHTSTSKYPLFSGNSFGIR